jgi:general secretion pathway protein K
MRLSSMSARRSPDEGFALLLVLIGLAVVALIIAAVVDSSRHYAKEAESSVDAMQLRAGTDAAVVTAVRDLAEAGAVTPPLLTHPVSVHLGDVEVSLSVRPEAAKIDLNAADPALIRALLLVLEFKPEAATRVSDQIADWRDLDSDLRPHGAEASDYIAAGRFYVPPNRDIESISELAFLLNGSEDLVVCLAPFVTVFSHRADVEPTAAAEPVRRALNMIKPQSFPEDTTSSASIVAGHAVVAGEIFEIDTYATGASGPAMSRRTILRMTGDPRRPYWVLSQTSPVPRPDVARAACGRAALAVPR